jgi:hypothetical protein
MFNKPPSKKRADRKAIGVKCTKLKVKFERRHDIHHNDTHHNDTLYNVTVTLSIQTLNIMTFSIKVLSKTIKMQVKS